MKTIGCDGADIGLQATAAFEAEKKKVEDARAALPDVETMLSLDELQVSLPGPEEPDTIPAAAAGVVRSRGTYCADGLRRMRPSLS